MARDAAKRRGVFVVHFADQQASAQHAVVFGGRGSAALGRAGVNGETALAEPSR